MRRLPLLLLSLAACHTSATPPPPAAFTLHYHRALADYSGWTVQTSAGAAEASAAALSTDGFGAVYHLTVTSGAPKLSFTLANGSTSDAAGALSVDISGPVREAWVFSGFAEAIPRALPAVPKASQVAVYYLRPDAAYTGWGLHTWGDVVTLTAWGSPLQPAGVDPEFGAGFVFDLKPGGDQVNFIVHKADTKDPGPDMGWSVKAFGNIIFLLSGSANINSRPVKVGQLSIVGASAHLISRDTLAWNVTGKAPASYELRYSATAAVAATDTDVTGGSLIALAPNSAGLTTAQQQLVPHLATVPAFSIAAADLAKVKDALKGQLIAVARDAAGKVVQATQVQTAFALDDLHSWDGPLGVTFSAGAPTLRLWAPTAQAVKLHVYDASKTETDVVTPTVDAQGVWTSAGLASWKGRYYRYELDVYHPVTGRIEHVVTTDPYAVNLDTNGNYAQLIDLSDPALKPAGWDALAKPALAAPQDIVIYESHIRDFSATDTTVPAAERGKYLAFTEAGSDGMKHLAALRAAGLTHLHLLPAFDFATVDEDPANRVDLSDGFDRLCAKNSAVPAALCTQFGTQTIAQALASFAGDSDQQQAIAGYLHAIDSFNWGYDPFHYGAPEGSYASTAEGTAKVLEFRKMVQGLAGAGLRTVMDVVYNHTNAAGLGDKSVLDKVVPGYYHRLDADSGAVLSSSCCANTASEHHMMGKLMTDTLVRWARDYKVDGFRFDLMGLHMKADILNARDALAALTPGADGVDGSKIYLYGEGWEVGELAKNARGTNANQANMAGTGIGTFNDRIRDAGRGGGPFDSGGDLRKNQGFANGLFLDPNELDTVAAATQKDALAASLDRIKVGMAGNLADFRLTTYTDSQTSGQAVPYNGARAGYTQSPEEAINYVSAHDNQTLWDIFAYKLPTGTSIADRVRAYDAALDIVLLGQGVPFFHLGDDTLRSKSMERDSYDSGDWFNRVDWKLQGNGFRSGLPNAGKDQANWPAIKTLFADATATPGPSDIAAAGAHFREMLQIRKSSPLFRLRTKDDVMKRVDFKNAGSAQVPGVVVMTITDGACGVANLPDLDPARDALVVIVNPDKVAHTMTVAGASGFTLHTVLQGSADSVVKSASASGTSFTVPARTTAVFEQLQGAARGAGLPCNAN